MEWRWRRVVDMREMGMPRIVERSLQDNGLKESTIAPKTRLILVNTSNLWTPENASTRI